MQAQGSEARIVLFTESVFKQSPEIVIEDCEVAWDEHTNANVTNTADVVLFKKGTHSAKLAVAIGATADELLSTNNFAAKNVALYTHIAFWLRSSVNLAAGDLQLLLDETAQCASPLETLNIPATLANTWTFHKLTLAAPASLTAIISIGIKQHVDKAAFDLYIDDVRALASQGKTVPLTSEGLALDRALQSSKTLRSNRNPVEPVRGNKKVAGALSGELSAYIERQLLYAFGNVSTVAGSGLYTHTFTIGNLPAFGYEKAFTDIAQYFLYNGCKMSKMDVNCPQEGFITCNFDVAGGKETVSSVPYDDDPIDDPFSPFDAFGAQITQGGAILATVTAINFSLDNGVKTDNYAIDRTNPGEVVSLPAGKIAIKGSLTAFFEDLTLYNLALNNTTTSVALDFERGTGAGTLGNEKLTFTMEEVKLQPKSPAISGDEGIKIELTFEAFYSTGASASALKAVLINSQAVV
jgi:hypothetical protein